jgi:hypothetical protein
MLSSIPTPNNSAIGIGPLTVHYYALCIIAGVAVAIWLGNKRYRAFANNSEQSIGVVADVAIYAVPAGIIGGRVYHVITSPAQYFGENGNPIELTEDDMELLAEEARAEKNRQYLDSKNKKTTTKKIANKVELPPKRKPVLETTLDYGADCECGPDEACDKCIDSKY